MLSQEECIELLELIISCIDTSACMPNYNDESMYTIIKDCIPSGVKYELEQILKYLREDNKQ